MGSGRSAAEVSRRPLCAVSEVKDGGAKGFPEHGVFVVRRGGRIDVWRDDCPHQNVPMAWRTDEYLNREGTRIVCAAHGALFDMDSGECVLGACLGDCLERVPHELVDGVIVIRTNDKRS